MVIILTIKLPNISNNVLILNFAITQLRVPLIFILSLLGRRLISEGLNKNFAVLSWRNFTIHQK